MAAELKPYSKLSNVILASIVSLIAILAIGIYDFTLPIFTEGESGSFGIVGVIVSLVYIASFLAEIPVGLATDKFGRIKVMIAALAIIAFLAIVYFFTFSILQLAILSLLFGAIVVAFWVPSTVLIRDFSPKKITSQAQGVYLSITQIGWILAPVMAGFIALTFSDRHNFLAVAGFALLAIIFTLILLRRKETKHSRKPIKPRITLLSDSFKRYKNMHRHAISLYSLTAIVYVWIAVQWTFVPLISIMKFGFNEIGAGMLLGAMSAIEGAMFFSSSYVMDKIGKKYIVTGGFILLFAATYFAFLAHNPLVYVFSLLLAAGSISWILPGTEALLTEIAPSNILGEMSAVFDTAKDIGLMVGPIVAGFLIEIFFAPQISFLLIAIFAGSGAVISGLLFWPDKH